MANTPPQLPVWSAPLVPVALALTAGVVLDRYQAIPLAASFSTIALTVGLWLVFVNTAKKTPALIYLWCALAGLGAAYHHWHRYFLSHDDLANALDATPRPARLRGVLQSAPSLKSPQEGPLRSYPTDPTTRFVLRATHHQDLTTRTWKDVTGLVQVSVKGKVNGLTVGDEVELLGRLSPPASAMNPGGFSEESYLRDQGITTKCFVHESNEVVLVQRGWPRFVSGILAAVRGWAQETLERGFSSQRDIAAALLLGETSGMTSDAWQQYQRTGVLHALAISGQHLSVLAAVLWFGARIAGIRRRYAAIAIALFLIAYALMTGGRPPVMRAAWIVAAYCGGMVFLRPVSLANTFALAWNVVLVFNPTDAFNVGCQLSFLAVAVLAWGFGRLTEQPEDPLQRLLDASRPWPIRTLLWLGRWLFALYGMNAIVLIAVTPLIAAHYHTVSPIAFFIGPPVVVLTSLALICGFAFLLFSWCAPLAWVFASLTQISLSGCETLVSLGERAPWAYLYVADIPTWWLWIFYGGLLAGLLSSSAWRHGRWSLAVVFAWLALLIALQLWPHRPDEFRCTFVAVGHGGCTVLETPSGRVIVYDAGAKVGPDVTRQHIAPFLWSRGIRHIDMLLLSHGDLDHFNGIPALADRFTIGRVISTPTFAERNLAGMKAALAALESRGLAVEVTTRGKSWEVDGVSFEVLHPPLVGPTKNENVRSLVLLVKHGDWSMLLTGDLEEAGLTQVLGQKAPPIDVLQAPHHGSDSANIKELARWAKPKLVISSQAEPTSERVSVSMYRKAGARYLSTWQDGAITIRPMPGGFQVETFRSKVQERFR